MSRLSLIISQYNKPEIVESSQKELSFNQKRRLLNNFTLAEICKILGKDEIYLSEITSAQYEKLIKIKFNPDALKLFCIHHPISVGEGYEYGWQDSKLFEDDKMWYISFTDMFMADIDDISQLDEVKRKILESGLTARIYITFNGFHVFITSEIISHNSKRCFELSDYLGSDIYYKLFSRRFGYKVRLNPKKNRDEFLASIFLEKIGEKSELENLVDLLKIHDDFVLKHQRETSSSDF